MPLPPAKAATMSAGPSSAAYRVAQPPQVVLPGAVRRHPDAAAAAGRDGLRHPGQGVMIAPDHGHGHAVAREGLGGRRPDPAGSPGDHRDLASQIGIARRILGGGCVEAYCFLGHGLPRAGLS